MPSSPILALFSALVSFRLFKNIPILSLFLRLFFPYLRTPSLDTNPSFWHLKKFERQSRMDYATPFRPSGLVSFQTTPSCAFLLFRNWLWIPSARLHQTSGPMKILSLLYQTKISPFSQCEWRLSESTADFETIFREAILSVKYKARTQAAQSLPEWTNSFALPPSSLIRLFASFGLSH